MSIRVGRFEDLITGQKARRLTAAVYRATSLGAFAKDFGLRDQIQRAAEVRSQRYIALDAGYLDQPNFDNLMTQATEVSKITGGLRASVQRQRDAK